MDQIELTPRPKREPMGDDYTIFGLPLIASLCFLVLAVITSDPGLRIASIVASGVMGLVAILGLPIFLDDWSASRGFPNRLQKHLQSPLSPGDYEKVRNIAKRHPEVQPWIAEVMDANGRILYRDAELLQEKINQYLMTLPEKELKNMVHPNRKVT